MHLAVRLLQPSHSDVYKRQVENGLTMERAQALGLQFCKENFPGHPAIVCTHPDGHNSAGTVSYTQLDVYKRQATMWRAATTSSARMKNLPSGVNKTEAKTSAAVQRTDKEQKNARPPGRSGE